MNSSEKKKVNRFISGAVVLIVLLVCVWVVVVQYAKVENGGLNINSTSTATSVFVQKPAKALTVASLHADGFRVYNQNPKWQEIAQIPRTGIIGAAWMHNVLYWAEEEKIEQKEQQITRILQASFENDGTQAVESVGVISGAITQLQASPKLPILSYTQRGDLYSLNANSGTVQRVAEDILASRWSSEDTALLAVTRNGVEYIIFNAQQNITNRVQVADAPTDTVVGVEFLSTNVAALVTRSSSEIILSEISLQGAGESELKRVSLNDVTKGAAQGVTKGTQQAPRKTSLFLSPQHDRLAIFDSVVGGFVVPLTKDDEPLTLKAGERPVAWTNEDTLQLLKDDSMIELVVTTGLQTPVASNISDPVVQLQ